MNASERIARAEEELALIFEDIDSREVRLTRKVLDAFRNHGVALRHFAPSTGYGYDDTGRDTLAEIVADLFGTEAAILRPQIASSANTKKYLASRNDPGARNAVFYLGDISMSINGTSYVGWKDWGEYLL